MKLAAMCQWGLALAIIVACARNTNGMKHSAWLSTCYCKSEAAPKCVGESIATLADSLLARMRVL